MSVPHHPTELKVRYISPILNVSDMAASFEWFGKLGFGKAWDWGEPPDFGAVGAGEAEIR